MKRLIGLAVLFVVLSVCVPASYGASGYYFLIYNVSTTVTGGDNSTDAKATIPLKGYLVLEFADGCDTLADANLILYGNDADTPKKKVYVQINKGGSDVLLGVNTWHVSDLVFIDTWATTPFNFEITLQGKTTMKDIGYGTKKSVAGSMKGVTIVWNQFLLGPAGQDVSGTATASASLNTAATKYVNKNGLTQNQIVVDGDGVYKGIIQMLEDKGYVNATP